ncbi:MAG: FUSC family protein [Rhodoplanes sp.]|uniref:FUSC family protein n=1 Tax=Rhodoplanes sp. TaxID=1968906 RepID=UPI0017B1C3FF|nr:FUSC family protein [Rhodoplanes sp.]NVO16676.1 FUSC family protein [Rhodoplanes sp.]
MPLPLRPSPWRFGARLRPSVRAWRAARDLSRRAVPDTAGLRRSWLFLVCIGIPFVTGTLLEQPGGALLGALIGMMTCFGDEDQRGLGARWLVLIQVALGMVAGGMLGTLLDGYQNPFWFLFGVALFAAGWLNKYGKGPHLGTRFGAIALGLTAGMPGFAPSDFSFVLLAFVVAGIARTIDHLLFGPMPALPGFKPPPRLEHHHEWLRFAAAYAAVAALGLWIGIELGMTRAIWITVAPLVVMLPGAQATYRRIVEFMFGTTVGVVVAWVLIHTLHAPLVSIVAVVAIAPLIPLQMPRRFWLQTALIAVMLLIAFRLALPDPRSVSALIVERLEDILLGCGLALVGAVLAFGRSPDRAAEDAAVARPRLTAR